MLPRCPKPRILPGERKSSYSPTGEANCDKFVLSGADLLYWRRKREQWRLLAEGAPDDATADYLHRYFEPTARAIDGLEKALAGLGLLDQALALDLRKPQDYFHRVWATAFRATDLAEAAEDSGDPFRRAARRHRQPTAARQPGRRGHGGLRVIAPGPEIRTTAAHWPSCAPEAAPHPRRAPRWPS